MISLPQDFIYSPIFLHLVLTSWHLLQLSQCWRESTQGGTILRSNFPCIVEISKNVSWLGTRVMNLQWKKHDMYFQLPIMSDLQWIEKSWGKRRSFEKSINRNSTARLFPCYTLAFLCQFKVILSNIIRNIWWSSGFHLKGTEVLSAKKRTCTQDPWTLWFLAFQLLYSTILCQATPRNFSTYSKDLAFSTGGSSGILRMPAARHHDSSCLHWMQQLHWIVDMYFFKSQRIYTETEKYTTTLSSIFK